MTRADNYSMLCQMSGNKQDSSYHAALYLLSYNSELCRKAKQYISETGISFSRMKEIEYLDQEQAVLASIAHNLFSWNSSCDLSPHDLAFMGLPLLDDFCNALYIANGMYKVHVKDHQLTVN